MGYETTMLAIAASLVATLFGLLVAVLGWLGAKVVNRLDAVVTKLEEVKTDLHERINGIDRRVVKLEVSNKVDSP